MRAHVELRQNGPRLVARSHAFERCPTDLLGGVQPHRPQRGDYTSGAGRQQRSGESSGFDQRVAHPPTFAREQEHGGPGECIG